jgi:4-amino-4-deoxy-L-arabinose transferase-like glycosyltransferase
MQGSMKTDSRLRRAQSSQRLRGIIFSVVAAVSILTAFWGLASRAVGNHEAYVAVTAREMVNSGNWVMPFFNGEPRLQKTPLSYWLTAAAAKAAGSVNSFVVRLPSAVLAVLSAVAIFYFVSDQLGMRIAALSSLIWSTSLCYIRYSHTGRPEMALTAFVAIAMLSFYSAVKAQSRQKQVFYILVFWLSFSFAMLAKGPAPLPLIFPALFFYFTVFRRWRLIGKLLPIAGVILFLLIFLPWPIAVLMKFPQAAGIWKNEFLGRAAGEYAAGSKPFYYYFGTMFVHSLPFSAFIPLAIIAPFYQIWEKKREAMFYMWFWFIAGVLVMSVCGGKRQHYILPLMPAMAVLTGIILDDMIFEQKSYSKKFAVFFLAGHLFAIFAGGTGMIIWAVKKGILLQWQILTAGFIVLAVLFVMVVMFWLGKRYFATICLFSSLCLVVIAWPFVEETKEDENYIIKDFAQQVSKWAKDKPIFAYCDVDASFIYYFGRDVPVLYDIDKTYESCSDGQGVVAADERFEPLKNDARFRLLILGLDERQGLFVREQISK